MKKMLMICTMFLLINSGAQADDNMQKKEFFNKMHELWKTKNFGGWKSNLLHYIERFVLAINNQKHLSVDEDRKIEIMMNIIDRLVREYELRLSSVQSPCEEQDEKLPNVTEGELRLAVLYYSAADLMTTVYVGSYTDVANLKEFDEHFASTLVDDILCCSPEDNS